MKLFLNAIVFSLAILLYTSAIAADTFKDEAAMKKFTDDFMEKVGKGDLTAAFDFLRPYVNMNNVDFDNAVNGSMQQRQKFALQYGPPMGHEFIRQRKVGEVLYRLQYIEIAKKQAVVWSFYFLKSGDTWRLDEFDWKDRLEVLFETN
jgi:hypothetical protein